ncbi:hypothetical protein CKAH01_15718 [Colletotrichum kahawae]|uniref:Uncharacterized protein n=1 Tax=Colletotrichum kahawae TaxID=34407 RepID=A0AAD9YGI9_COLKA|nr:hypothetical protein CKAH01_15718 [Colletotrichum kahawae]
MDGNSSFRSWVPPPVDEWNLVQDCSVYARFVSTIVRGSSVFGDDLDFDMCFIEAAALVNYVAILPTFYYSSVLLSLGIVIASLKFMISNVEFAQEDRLLQWQRGESTYSPYDIRLATIASLFSTLPPLMAGFMLRMHSERRRLFNVAILRFLGMLLLTVTIMAFSDIIGSPIPEKLEFVFGSELSVLQEVIFPAMIVASFLVFVIKG